MLSLNNLQNVIYNPVNWSPQSLFACGSVESKSKENIELAGKLVQVFQ